MKKKIGFLLLIVTTVFLTACQPQKPSQVEIGVKEKALINKFVEMSGKRNMQDYDMWEEIDNSEEIAPYLQAAYEEQKSNNFKYTTNGVDIKNLGFLWKIGQTLEKSKEYPILEPEIVKSILLFRIHATYAMKMLDPDINIESVYSTTSLFYEEDKELGEYSVVKVYKNNQKIEDYYTFVATYFPYVYRPEVRKQIQSLTPRSRTFTNRFTIKKICETDQKCEDVISNGYQSLLYKKEVKLWYGKDRSQNNKIVFERNV